MKIRRNLILSIMGMIVFVNLEAQQCTVCSQADVDAWNTSFTTSSIYISGNDITNLDGMSNLDFMSGPVFGIYDNPRLKDISGLQNINMVPGTLKLFNNDSLTLIDLAPNPIDLEIYNNDMLESISLSNTFINKFTIMDNNALLSLYIENESADSDLIIQNNLNFINCTLTNSMLGTINISNNSALSNLDGFSVIDEVTETISISDNSSLVEYCGLRNILLNEPLIPLNLSGNLFNPSNEYIIADGACGNFVVKGSGFATLPEALVAAADYSFIRARKDVTFSEATTFPGGQNLTLVIEPFRTLTFDAPFTNEGIIINHGTLKMINGQIFTNVGPSINTGNIILED